MDIVLNCSLQVYYVTIRCETNIRIGQLEFFSRIKLHTFACTHTITQVNTDVHMHPHTWSQLIFHWYKGCFTLQVKWLILLTEHFVMTMCADSTAFASIQPLWYKLSLLFVFAEQQKLILCVKPLFRITQRISNSHSLSERNDCLRKKTKNKKIIHLIGRVGKVLAGSRPWEGPASFHATS